MAEAGRTSLAFPTPPQTGFFALPPELRELVYCLYFEPLASDSSTEVDLRKPNPPSKALLLTCKTVDCEAHALFTAAYRRYWTDSHFILDHRPFQLKKHDSPESPDLLPYERHIAHVNHLKVLVTAPMTARASPRGTYRLHLVHPKGGWRVVLPQPTHTGHVPHIRLRVWITRGSVDYSQIAWDGHRDEASAVEACESCGQRLSVAQQAMLLPTATGLHLLKW